MFEKYKPLLQSAGYALLGNSATLVLLWLSQVNLDTLSVLTFAAVSTVFTGVLGPTRDRLMVKLKELAAKSAS